MANEAAATLDNTTARQRWQTLGSQISALVKQYNDRKQELMALPDHPTKEQLRTLLEERRAAVDAILQQHRAAIEALRTEAEGGALPAFLQGMGAAPDALADVEAEIAVQQGKLNAWQQYFETYKASLLAGTEPPPLPPELGTTSQFSGTQLAIGAALLLGLLWLMSGKK